jgi:hypothetical protein
VGWADYALCDRRRRLQRSQLLEPGFSQATAELGQDLRQNKVVLGTVHLPLGDAAGLPHRQVRPQLVTELFVGTLPFMLA